MDNNKLTTTIERAIAGDVEAYEALMQRYTSYILVFAENLADTPEDAEDIAQEVAIEIFTSIGKLSSPYAFASWLRMLILNVARTYNQKKARQTRGQIITDTIPERPVVDTEDLPEESAFANESALNMYKLIEKLPVAQRKVLFLFYYEDMSYADIAKTLSIRESTVGSNIKKAKNRMAKLLVENELTKANIANAFAASVPLVASGTAVNHFAEITAGVCKLGAEAVAKTTVHHATALASKLLIKVAAGVVGTGAAAGMSVAILVNPSPAPDTTPNNNVMPPAQVVAPVYTAEKAKIFFVGKGELGENVDPVSAQISVNDTEGTSDDWFIKNKSGTSIASGAGSKMQIPKDLKPGKYTITWKVKAGGSGASAIVHRDFYISG